ncbi:MAG TPA: small ribosomal subunit Rsm22 family protein, partial [Afipia sp.]
DERFSYVALSRIALVEHPARILSQPVTTKISVSAKLCTVNGIKHVAVPRRDKISYAKSRKWNWGDAVPDVPAE